MTARSRMQTTAYGDITLREAMLIQTEAMIGVNPRIKPGMASNKIQAIASLGRLISPSRLPASESSERRLVLDASSSMSPRRGSTTVFMASRLEASLHQGGAPCA
jgi:hypothetical protein